MAVHATERENSPRRWRPILGAAIAAGAMVLFGPTASAQAVVTGPFWYAAAHSGKCMDVTGESTAQDVGIQQWSCVSDGSGKKGNQMWYHDKPGDGTLTLRNEKSGRCVDAYRGRGVQVVQWTCDGSHDQKWRSASINGKWRFESVQYPGYCLDVQGASTANGAKVILYGCHTGNNQLWS
ncbi:RICIN domain-containing protein [Streptomyces sp. NPDC029004]|uniref:RICIN domain-containing protein n=1 Tax=Streptomyces sp. NPDC029004 TaxID=3154490 RepID=UPI003405F4C5